MCKELGQEPDPDKIPIEIGDFPLEFQYILNIYHMLSDKWEGMSGTYMGKDFNLLPFIYDMYEIDRDFGKKVFSHLIIIDNVVKKYYADKRNRESKTLKANKGNVKRS